MYGGWLDSLYFKNNSKPTRKANTLRKFFFGIGYNNIIHWLPYSFSESQRT